MKATHSSWLKLWVLTSISVVRFGLAMTHMSWRNTYSHSPIPDSFSQFFQNHSMDLSYFGNTRYNFDFWKSVSKVFQNLTFWASEKGCEKSKCKKHIDNTYLGGTFKGNISRAMLRVFGNRWSIAIQSNPDYCKGLPTRKRKVNIPLICHGPQWMTLVKYMASMTNHM